MSKQKQMTATETQLACAVFQALTVGFFMLMLCWQAELNNEGNHVPLYKCFYKMHDCKEGCDFLFSINISVSQRAMGRLLALQCQFTV